MGYGVEGEEQSWSHYLADKFGATLVGTIMGAGLAGGIMLGSSTSHQPTNKVDEEVSSATTVQETEEETNFEGAYMFEVPEDDGVYQEVKEDIRDSTYKTHLVAEYKLTDKRRGFRGKRGKGKNSEKQTVEDIVEGEVKFPSLKDYQEEFYKEALEKGVYSLEKKEGDVIELDGHGTSTAIAEDEDQTGFWTANHLIPPKKMKTRRGILERQSFKHFYKVSYVNEDGEEVEKKVEMNLAYRDKDLDTAVFTSKTAGEELDIPRPDVNDSFADIDRIELGNVVLNSGYPLNLKKAWTVGKFTSYGMDEVPERFPWDDEAFYIMDKHTNPGESGSAIYVLDKGKDGEIEARIAGMVNWGYPRAQAVNGASMIDKSLEEMEDHWLFFDPDVK